MKSIQKIILIKVVVILSIAFVILNVSQLHLNNNNNKLNLKRRDTKFFIQEETIVSFNNKNNNNNNNNNDIEINSSVPIISIDENDNNKNSIINQLNSDSSNNIKSSEDLIIFNESSESLESSAPNQGEIISNDVPVPTSYDNLNNDVDADLKFVPGEAPKYSNRNLDC